MRMLTLRGFAAAWCVIASLVPQAAEAQSPRTLAEIAFLSGCWEGRMGSLDMREQWSSPDGGVMLGTTRFLRDGSVVDFEFARIEQEGSGVTLWPYPRGVISEHGFPLVRTDGEYVFENLEHDFPVRIVYVRVGANGLAPRIEGRDGSGTEWSLSRVTCPG